MSDIILKHYSVDPNNEFVLMHQIQNNQHLFCLIKQNRSNSVSAGQRIDIAANNLEEAKAQAYEFLKNQGK